MKKIKIINVIGAVLTGFIILVQVASAAIPIEVIRIDPNKIVTDPVLLAYLTDTTRQQRESLSQTQTRRSQSPRQS